MGRGRAKAKQTKVARELKYNSGGMDLDRLRADLIHEDAAGGPVDEIDPELLAKYGDLADAGDEPEVEDDEDDDLPHEGYGTR
jgi:Protein of unknown function (DUF3073)